MLTYSVFKSSIIENSKRILTVLQFGAKTADEVLPFGIDSSPIKDMTAIYGSTSNNSESVVIGYINKNQIAESGETRFYSLDSDGNEKAFIFLKKDGKIHLNGNAYTSVRFSPLKTGLDNQNLLINAELVKIQTAITTLGGAYVPSNVSTNITNAESIDVKLK